MQHIDDTLMPYCNQAWSWRDENILGCSLYGSKGTWLPLCPFAFCFSISIYLSLSSLSPLISLSPSLFSLSHTQTSWKPYLIFLWWQLRNCELKIRLCCDFLLNGFWFVFIFLPRAGSWTFLRGGDVQFQIELVYNLSRVCSSWWHEICKWPACFERKWTAKLSMNKCQTDTIHLNRMYSGILYILYWNVHYSYVGYGLDTPAL